MSATSPTTIRVIDYSANLGGGVRFVREVLTAFVQSGPPDLRIEVVSHGEGLERYRPLLSSDPPVRLRDIPEANAPLWAFRGFSGARLLNQATGRLPMSHHISAAAMADCDIVWLPWLHWHRVPPGSEAKVVASFHDTIALDIPGIFPEADCLAESDATRNWLRSAAKIAVSSDATRASLNRLFGTDPSRVAMIPLSGLHRSAASAPVPGRSPFAGRPYLLCPANITRHKNHEVLFRGVARWGARHPLVLTGEGADLLPLGRRSRDLRRAADEAGLRRGRSLHPLGYIDVSKYRGLLAGAWALVMPTLAEGGGSFPVLEALNEGIPVVCSDIPVMREMVARFGGEPLWFDPASPEDLAAKLRLLESDYPRFLAEARAKAGTLKRRSWEDVAADYAQFMGLAWSKR